MAGKLTDNRFELLSTEYEKEMEELKQSIRQTVQMMRWTKNRMDARNEVVVKHY